jgi:hypothetical protein
MAEFVAAKLHAMRKAIAPTQSWLRDAKEVYVTEEL